MSSPVIHESIPAAWDHMEGVHPPEANAMLEGHDQALNELALRYSRERLHHAWLIHGPRGIGKATFAFRFAEHLFRNPDPSTAPHTAKVVDDEIHSRVALGGEANLLVIRRPYDHEKKKFKTRITVGETRGSLIRFLGQTSGTSAWRVVILDPADDMNSDSANALLKFLEEPPPRTIFLILAHSPRGLLATIRSRCQMLALKPLENDQVRNVVMAQPAAESISADSIGHAIELARGSPRRALQLVEGGIEAMFGEFMEAARAPKPDYGTIYRLAGKLALPARVSEFAMFMDLVRDHLADAARSGAVNDQVPLRRIANLAEIWESLEAHIARNAAFNLDRKQIILDLYHQLRSA